MSRVCLKFEIVVKYFLIILTYYFETLFACRLEILSGILGKSGVIDFVRLIYKCTKVLKKPFRIDRIPSSTQSLLIVQNQCFTNLNRGKPSGKIFLLTVLRLFCGPFMLILSCYVMLSCTSVC